MFTFSIQCFNQSNQIGIAQPHFFILNKGFEKYLSENDYAVFWTLLGEKRKLHDTDRADFRGLDLTGVFTVDDTGQIIGEMVSKESR